MISTVTPSVLATVANGSVLTILSTMTVVALITLVVVRELAVAVGGPARRLGRDLPVVIVPLLLLFADIVLSRLLTPH